MSKYEYSASPIKMLGTQKDYETPGKKNMSVV